MRVVGFSGYSGSGKTTLLEQLIARMAARGLCVAVVKHAHHRFDVDQPGKDSWRHRQAGASEVLVASELRFAKIREHRGEPEPTLAALIAELRPDADWVLVEGFKHEHLRKIEIWRDGLGHDLRAPSDTNIVAVATDSPAQCRVGARSVPILDLNDADAVLAFLLADPDRYAYPAAAR